MALQSTLPARRPRVAVDKPLGVAIIGCGYWGPNLIRNFMACAATRVAMLCDRDQGRLQKCSSGCPEAILVQEIEEVFANHEVEAVAIATPAATHAQLARAALQAG